ncbi:MAG: TonB-dependent receptor [Ignavibacteriota bacterium]|jgi:hemoglobin/transferrin/lactoferrin receptor protein|nr:MAG: TonB-dependent receptor [Chlorobiota bacterium]MBE7475990.1 TonB-dependent receptor [Ignavibacteriales bacterium]MBL1123202.1 TonB-dependent receptor [Ignavibacteriota bacterium]MCC7095131.1 TonB-dependent receptor [Ignavibacteriaceae bacterium]MCE7856845.1 TonB-dependent receptor [Ignavibacteria bacterium CHB3]MEB2295714.1 TonB-dependent receptor [Ignavibacteria bacterium]
MKKILLLIFLLTAVVSAQVVTVKDQSTNKSLELVAIYNSDPNRSVITNTNGQADISKIDKSQPVIFRLIGYEKTELSYSKIEENNFVILLKPTAISLDNVVVSSSRWEENKSEVPNTIEMITPRDIEFQNPQTTADMLGMSGNVFIQKSQLGGGSPMIRGFATNRLLIVVDGVRMNTAIFRSGNLQNVISLDANALDHTEVIFGPGSVIYGSDAIGGVMNFHTLTPRLSLGDEVMLNVGVMGRFSSADLEKSGHLHFNIGLNNWGFLTSVTYSDFDDLVMGSNGPDEYLRPTYQTRINGKDTVVVNPDPKKQVPSGYNQVNFLQKILFAPISDWEFEYAFHYSTTSDYPRYDRLLRPRGNTLRSAEWYYGPQKWMMNNLMITNFSGNSIYDLSKLIVAYQNFEESRHDRNLNNDDRTNNTEKVNAFSANLDMIKEINENSNLFYGVEIVLNKVESTGNSENIVTGEITPGPSRYPDGSTWNSYGAYLTYKNKFSPQYIFQAGLRYNYVTLDATFDTTFYPFPFTKAEERNGALTGNAGLVWHPQSDWQINLNLASGFRSPNIDDIGKVFDSEPGSVVIPNPDIEPEYAYNIELGLTKIFSNLAEFSAVGYYTYLDNALVRRDFTLNGMDSIMYNGEMSQVQAIQNAAFATIYGVELGLNLNFLENFNLRSSFSYQKGEEEDDAGNKVPLRHAAPWFGKTEFIFMMNRLEANLYMVYNGEIKNEDLAPSEQEKDYIYAMDESGNPYQPSWYTLNLKISYQLLDNFELYLGVENITDQRYRPYSSGISAAGRNFIGSLRVNI